MKATVEESWMDPDDEEEEADEGPVDTSDDEEDDHTPIPRRSKKQMYVWEHNQLCSIDLFSYAGRLMTCLAHVQAQWFKRLHLMMTKKMMKMQKK